MFYYFVVMSVTESFTSTPYLVYVVSTICYF